MESELGKFVRWMKPLAQDGTQTTIDLTRKAIMVLAGAAQIGNLIETPTEEVPSDEVLDLRTQSY